MAAPLFYCLPLSHRSPLGPIARAALFFVPETPRKKTNNKNRRAEDATHPKAHLRPPKAHLRSQQTAAIPTRHYFLCKRSASARLPLVDGLGAHPLSLAYPAYDLGKPVAAPCEYPPAVGLKAPPVTKPHSAGLSHAQSPSWTSQTFFY